jgi:hypothetical protein
MKKAIIIILVAIAMLPSCKKECNFPPAPYGTPDDVTEYVSRGYNSIMYTYYCYNGRYVSVTYSNTEGCVWEDSYFYSTCIK